MRTVQVILNVKIAEISVGKSDIGHDCKRLIEAEIGYVAEVEVVAQNTILCNDQQFCSRLLQK